VEPLLGEFYFYVSKRRLMITYNGMFFKRKISSSKYNGKLSKFPVCISAAVETFELQSLLLWDHWSMFKFKELQEYGEVHGNQK
jgi:hypothetical protein